MKRRTILFLSCLCVGAAAPVPLAAAHDKSQAQPDRNDPDAVRCRKFSVTGSLVRKERVCRTNAEWRVIADQQNRDSDNLIERLRAGMDCRAGGPGGC